jgi:shikimate dehydrogenase
VVVGAGGAARAVIRALVGAGARDIAVVNRTAANGERAAAVAGSIGRLGTLDDISSADLVVNATSVGMGATDVVHGATPFPVELLRPSQFVADLVVHPVETPLLRAASTCGATPVDGVGMLVHQAAIAFELWTGAAPPIATMQAAARAVDAR